MTIPRKKATIKVTLVPSSKGLSVLIKNYTNATLEMTPQQRVDVINNEGFIIDGKEILIHEIKGAIQKALEELCTNKLITVKTEYQIEMYS